MKNDQNHSNTLIFMLHTNMALVSFVLFNGEDEWLPKLIWFACVVYNVECAAWTMFISDKEP